MKKIYSLLPIALSPMFLPLAGCHAKHDGEHSAETTFEVSVAYPLADSVVLHKSYPGYVSATNEINIVARVNGTVVKKYFEDGAMVQKGAPLFSIESTNYADKVHQAEAALQTAIASNEYASREYEAMKKALESDAVSKMEVIQAESNMQQTEADIKNARAALQTARTMLGYCTVSSPYTGRAASPNVSVGDYVAGEGSPVVLTRVYDDHKVNVNFAIDDASYLALTETTDGKAVDLNHVPVSFGDTITSTFTGRLTYEAPGVNQSTGTLQLRLEVDNPDAILKSGMYANVNLPYAVDPHAIIIRDASIGTDQLGKYVYVVNDSNKVVYTPIKTGELYQDTLRIVTSGLNPTDRYVTTALMKVRDGMTVKPVAVNSPSEH